MSVASDFFGGGGGGYGNVPSFRPAGQWSKGTSRESGTNPFGFVGDGDYFSSTYSISVGESTIDYRTHTGAIVWTKTAANFGGEFIVGMMFDPVEGYLYTVVNTSSQELRFYKVDSAGAATFLFSQAGYGNSSSRTMQGIISDDGSGCSFVRPTLGTGRLTFIVNEIGTTRSVEFDGVVGGGTIELGKYGGGNAGVPIFGLSSDYLIHLLHDYEIISNNADNGGWIKVSVSIKEANSWERFVMSDTPPAAIGLPSVPSAASIEPLSVLQWGHSYYVGTTIGLSPTLDYNALTRYKASEFQEDAIAFLASQGFK